MADTLPPDRKRNAGKQRSGKSGKVADFRYKRSSQQSKAPQNRANAKRGSQKRGGGVTVLSIDAERAGGWEPSELSRAETPDRTFERLWARELIERARVATRLRYEENDNAAMFDTLEPFLPWNDGPQDYRGAARELGLSDGALRVNIFRLRKRFRSSLETEIAETVTSADEVEDEVSFLFAAFNS